MTQFVTDLEGPITLNDNAFELCQHFLPQGDIFFAQISRYDDYLSDIVRKKGYQAGDTLKLILPFLKAYGASEEKIKEYSQAHLLLVPRAAETLKKIGQMMPTFIISTSYQPYLEAFCEKVGFPLEKVYFTKLESNRFEVETGEEEILKNLRKEIVNLPLIEILKGAKRLENLALNSQKTINRLNKIFWEEIPTFKIGRLLKETKPVGGKEKVAALRDSLEKTGNSLREVFYVGDSITDVEVLKLVRQEGGLSLSFNGNRYVLEAAELACLSENASVLFDMAQVFNQGGREKILEFVSQSEKSRLSGRVQRLEIVNNLNRGRLIKESEAFRQKLRGKAGALG